MNETAVLRRLAHQYAEIAFSEANRENLALHRAVNDRRMIRPVVLIDELPWHEMDFDGSLTPVCEDAALREAEVLMRRTIYRHKYFPADMTVHPYLPVPKIIKESGIGLRVSENTLITDNRNHIISHEYHDQLADESALDALHPTVVTYDREGTMRKFERIADAVGDIVPIRLTGMDYIYSTPWDNIARYRGVSALLIDLAERPEYTHRMVDLLTGFEERRIAQYEELGLLDANPLRLHCTCAAVSDLPGKDSDGEKVTRRDIWGRGMAQIFASVSPAMHEEFDVNYMLRTIATCGLSYYGCCEPLDNKISVITKIPNLRKVGLTPWANARLLCEQVAGRYVVAAKPNPAAVAVPKVDADVLRKELSAIIEACRDNNCSCDIVLKDISTCLNRPENIFEWEKVAMEVARNG